MNVDDLWAKKIYVFVTIVLHYIIIIYCWLPYSPTFFFMNNFSRWSLYSFHRVDNIIIRLFAASAIRQACFYLQDTFSRAKTWVKELQRQASPNIVIALAGNKADMSDTRAVEHQVGSSPTTPHLLGVQGTGCSGFDPQCPQPLSKMP